MSFHWSRDCEPIDSSDDSSDRVNLSQFEDADEDVESSSRFSLRVSSDVEQPSNSSVTEDTRMNEAGEASDLLSEVNSEEDWSDTRGRQELETIDEVKEEPVRKLKPVAVVRPMRCGQPTMGLFECTPGDPEFVSEVEKSMSGDRAGIIVERATFMFGGKDTPQRQVYANTVLYRHPDFKKDLSEVITLRDGEDPHHATFVDVTPVNSPVPASSASDSTVEYTPLEMIGWDTDEDADSGSDEVQVVGEVRGNPEPTASTSRRS